MGVRSAVVLPETSCTPELFDVLDDAPAAGVVADVGEEVDATAEPRQPDRDVERAAADVLAGDLAVALDDVDQRLADDQRALRAHGSHASFRSSVSSVARAPSRCSESSAHR